MSAHDLYIALHPLHVCDWITTVLPTRPAFGRVFNRILSCKGDLQARVACTYPQLSRSRVPVRPVRREMHTASAPPAPATMVPTATVTPIHRHSETSTDNCPPPGDPTSEIFLVTGQALGVAMKASASDSNSIPPQRASVSLAL